MRLFMAINTVRVSKSQQLWDAATRLGFVRSYWDDPGNEALLVFEPSLFKAHSLNAGVLECMLTQTGVCVFWSPSCSGRFWWFLNKHSSCVAICFETYNHIDNQRVPPAKCGVSRFAKPKANQLSETVEERISMSAQPKRKSPQKLF